MNFKIILAISLVIFSLLSANISIANAVIPTIEVELYDFSSIDKDDLQSFGIVFPQIICDIPGKLYLSTNSQPINIMQYYNKYGQIADINSDDIRSIIYACKDILDYVGIPYSYSSAHKIDANKETYIIYFDVLCHDIPIYTHTRTFNLDYYNINGSKIFVIASNNMIDLICFDNIYALQGSINCSKIISLQEAKAIFFDATHDLYADDVNRFVYDNIILNYSASNELSSTFNNYGKCNLYPIWVFRNICDEYCIDYIINAYTGALEEFVYVYY